LRRSTEVDQHREQRADVHGHVKGQPLVGPAEEMRHQDQVTRARDRQELGQALHDGEDDGLKEIHVDGEPQSW
jgi:hypothetical protein